MSPKQYAVICVRKGHLTLKSNLSVIHPSRLFSNSLPPASSRECRHQQLICVCLQMALGLWRSKYWNAHSNLSFQKLWQMCKPHSEHCYLANCQSGELYIQTSKDWCHWCLHPLIWSYAPALRENSERYTLWWNAIFALSKAPCKGFRDSNIFPLLSIKQYHWSHILRQFPQSHEMTRRTQSPVTDGVAPKEPTSLNQSGFLQEQASSLIFSSWNACTVCVLYFCLSEGFKEQEDILFGS